jgi:hypothetical protein
MYGTGSRLETALLMIANKIPRALPKGLGKYCQVLIDQSRTEKGCRRRESVIPYLVLVFRRVSTPCYEACWGVLRVRCIVLEVVGKGMCYTAVNICLF